MHVFNNKLLTGFMLHTSGSYQLLLPWSSGRSPSLEGYHEHMPWIAVSTCNYIRIYGHSHLTKDLYDIVIVVILQ